MTVYFTLDPHPKVLEAYTAAGYAPSPVGKDLPKTQTKFFNVVAKPLTTKEYDKVFIITSAEELPDRPIKREITHIYRFKAADDKEYLFYHETLTGSTFVGNILSDDRRVGLYELPIFNRWVNKATQTVEIRDILEKQEQYEIPFIEHADFIDPSTHEKITIEDLQKFITRKTNLYVKTIDKTWGVTPLGVGFTDFITTPHEELVKTARGQPIAARVKVKA